MRLKRSIFSLLAFACLMAACAGPPPKTAESRGAQSAEYEITPDEHYRVRRGDSLYTIAFRYGLDWREIARLNGISAPYIIYPDQVLRLTQSIHPVSQASAASGRANGDSVEIAAAPAPSSTTSSTVEPPRSSTTRAYEPESVAQAETKPALPVEQVSGASAEPIPGAAVESVAEGGPAGTVPVGTQAPAGTSYSTPAGDPSRWLWPTEGRVISSFRPNDPARKGVDISGTAGQAVVASASGQVVYSGSGMLGYGELIIIKHSDRMLSAYAHNSKRLVSEGQQVPAGSQIATMGTNDRNQPVLHFEIRVNGSPDNPLKYLPQR